MRFILTAWKKISDRPYLYPSVYEDPVVFVLAFGLLLIKRCIKDVISGLYYFVSFCLPFFGKSNDFPKNSIEKLCE